MAILKTLLATVFFTLGLAQTTPNPAEFCTDATYPGGDTDGIPLGSGYCAAIDPDIGVCQTFAVDSPLVNNLTFVYIPPPYIYECNLYTDDACAGTPLTVSYGETDLSNRELSPPGYNDDVESWECFST